MRKCKVHLCENKASDKLSFFSLPSNWALRYKWIKFLVQSGCTEINNNVLCYICEKHFERDKIVVDSGNNRKTLTWDAVPTILDSNSQRPTTSKSISNVLTGLSKSITIKPSVQKHPTLSKNSQIKIVNPPIKYPIKNPPKETQAPKCAVKYCKSESNELFISPEDPVRLRKWKAAVGTIESEFYVCEIHFAKEDLIIDKNLDDNAVPKLRLNVVNYWKPDCCGMCLEKLQSMEAVYNVTKFYNETFEEISGYRPLSNHVCHDCKFVLTMFNDFKKKVQEVHEITRKGKDAKVSVNKPKVNKDAELMVLDSDDDDNDEALKKGIYQCDDCPFICNDNETLGKHIIKSHINKTINVRGLTHERRTHRFSGPRKVICFTCKKEFETDDQLLHHEAKAHGKVNKILPVGVPIKFADINHKSSLRIENSFELPKRNKRKSTPQVLTDDDFEIFEINELEEDDNNIEIIDYEPRTVEEVTLVPNSTLDLKDENDDEEPVKIITIPKRKDVNESTPTAQKPIEKKLSLYELKKLRIEKALPEVQIDNHKYKCLDCQEVLKSSATFIKHRFEVHPDKEERNKVILEKLDVKVKCAHCDEKLFEIYMQPHINSNHKERTTETPQYECDLCGKKCTTKSTLVDHIESSHKTNFNKEFQCEICKKKLYTKENFKRHKETLHQNGYDCGARCNPNTNAFHCGNCGGIFFCLKAMRTHGCVNDD